MSTWIDYTALWEIVVVGLLAGAGLPAVFALGLRALSAPGRGRGGTGAGAAGGASPAGIAVAALCFAIVLAAIGYGIFIIVASGHK